MEWYVGGYGSDTTLGIYKIVDDKLELVVQAKGTTYFDVVDDKIVTIENVAGKGHVAIYQKGVCLYRYVGEEKPGCYITVIKDNIYVAYYHDNCVKVFDWQLNLLHTWTYEKGKCHYIFQWQNDIGVICLAEDKIYFYDENNEFIEYIQFPQGSGPRHAILSKDETWLYVVSELSCECFVVNMIEKRIIQQVSILDTAGNDATGAAIKLSKDENHLYVSSRYDDTITHFAVADHQIKAVQYYKTQGKVPRDFELRDDEIMIGYQDSDFVEIIKFDERKNLTNENIRYPLGKVVCVKSLF